MPQFYDSISDDLASWAMRQSVFFIASAPNYGKHINLSPKGLPSTSLSVIGPNQCAYIDSTGSGAETISHLRENGRATLMFCSFGPSPRILRFFCRGRVVEWDEEKERIELLDKMKMKGLVAARSIIVLDVFKVQTSCGYGVPYLSLENDPKDSSKQVPVFADRDTIGHWGKKTVEQGKLDNYQAMNNVESLDGLPSLRKARKGRGERLLLLGDIKASAKGAATGLWHVAGAAVLVAVLSSLSTVLALSYAGLLQIDEEKRNWGGKYW